MGLGPGGGREAYGFFGGNMVYDLGFFSYKPCILFFQNYILGCVGYILGCVGPKYSDL